MQHGPDRRDDEIPDWMADKRRRFTRIRAAEVVSYLRRESVATMAPVNCLCLTPGEVSGLPLVA